MEQGRHDRAMEMQQKRAFELARCGFGNQQRCGSPLATTISRGNIHRGQGDVDRGVADVSVRSLKSRLWIGDDPAGAAASYAHRARCTSKRRGSAGDGELRQIAGRSRNASATGTARPCCISTSANLFTAALASARRPARHYEKARASVRDRRRRRQCAKSQLRASAVVV